MNKDEWVSESATRWLATLLFLELTSLGFAFFVEWGRYHTMLQWERLSPTIGDQAAIIWILVAKSLALSLPILLIAWAMCRRRWFRLAGAWVVLGWTILFSWLIADLIANGITGNSISSYLPYLLDMLRFPEKNYGNWLGEDLKLRVLELVSGCFLIGAFLFYGITWILRRWRSGSGPQPFSFVLRAATGFLILVLVGTVPAFSLFENRTLLLSIRRVLPVDTGLLESVSDPIRAATRSAPVGKEREKKGLRIASLAPAQGSKLQSDVVLRNFTSSDADLAGWRLVGANGKTFELSGRITAGQSFKIAIGNERIALSWHDGYLMLVDSEGWVQDKVSYSSTYFHPGRTWNFLINRDRKSCSTNVESIANKYRSRLLKMCSEVRPIDPSAHVEGKTLPHIVILILESFRYNTLTSDYMPRLQEWGAARFCSC